MRIWFDADNGPHVLVMSPLAAELERQGHEVFFTARDRANTCELLDLQNHQYRRVGKEFGKSTLRKIYGTLRRAALLKSAAKGWAPQVSFGHGSRSLPIASRLLNIPSLTMYDYEWVNPGIFNRFCSSILLPDCISAQRITEAGIRSEKVRSYPGFKENLYLESVHPGEWIMKDLGLSRKRKTILIRPPASKAHYHNPEADRLLVHILTGLLHRSDIQIVWLPRSDDQNRYVAGRHRADVVTPERVYPGPQLIMCMDAVIGGGGTMTREAALMGIPSISFFRGRRGAVDDRLASLGRLHMVSDRNSLPDILSLISQGRKEPAHQAETMKFVIGEILSS